MTTFDLRHEGRTGIEMGLGVGPQTMQGWPYSDFATGWYVIGYSSEIRPGEVKPARWFGQDLVVFRTESGALSALDAYCPHMGAHLGQPGEFGGRVCGEALQCPWHGWQWDTTGANVSIPYRPEGPIKARADRKHVRETDGIVVMWYDHAGEAPTYEWDGLPYIGDPADYYPIDTTVDGPHLAKPQFPFENSADPHHFQYVHGSGVDAEFDDYVVDGPRCTNTMRLVFGAGKEASWLTPNGPVNGYVDNFFWGASLGVARFRIDDLVCIHLPVLTPVDADHCIFFSTVTATKEPGALDDEPHGRSGRFMKAQHWQIRNDFHIWQHMKYRVRPIFTGDAEQSRYAFIRRHFDQFYPNPVY
jgi:phenylpropionate dioxygenase-like ring-hydroxylating dioxygenase large terminal subunit